MFQKGDVHYLKLGLNGLELKENGRYRKVYVDLQREEGTEKEINIEKGETCIRESWTEKDGEIDREGQIKKTFIKGENDRDLTCKK